MYQVDDFMNKSDTSLRPWTLALLIIGATLVARVFYLAFFSSWELVADEAHYWEWSRRLDLSYYTKGPGIAWVIWLSTNLFGDNEAAIRLPSAVASALMALAGARLAYEITGRTGGAAWCVALTLCLTPGLFATSQLATTDVFYATAWVVTALCFWNAVRPQTISIIRIAWWGLAGLVIGLGCLFKYTMLFELVGIGFFLVLQRRQLAWDRATIIGIVVGLIGILIASSPILIWNAQNGWPTIAHQVGRLRLPGGDEAVNWEWSPLWGPRFLGEQIALLGGVGAVLIWMSIRRSRDSVPSVARSMLIWLSIPMIIFYLVLSVFRQAQGNWAIAGYTTLLVLVGIEAASTLRIRPPTKFQSLWHWHLGIGIVVAMVLFIGPNISNLPLLKNIHALQRVSARISGASSRANEVHQLAESMRTTDGRAPLIVAKSYQDASLLAFYLPDHPKVYCAAHQFGSRLNAYDFFPDTKLDDPSLHGNDAILVGGDLNRWQEALKFDSIDVKASMRKTYIGKNFGGPLRVNPTERGSAN